MEDLEALDEPTPESDEVAKREGQPSEKGSNDERLGFPSGEGNFIEGRAPAIST